MFDATATVAFYFNTAEGEELE